jgi:hypothetical protein
VIRLPHGGLFTGFADELRTAELAQAMQACYLDSVRRTARIRVTARLTPAGPWPELAGAQRQERVRRAFLAEVDPWAAMAEGLTGG